MILVTTGTNGPPFDRLLGELDGLEEELVVQHGPSVLRPREATCFDYVPYPKLVYLVRNARVVVTHAGVGTILVALMNGKRPIVVPRLERFGEAVDDHQLELARRLDDQGLVTMVEDPRSIRQAIATANGNALEWMPDNHALVRDLRDYLNGIMQHPSA